MFKLWLYPGTSLPVPDMTTLGSGLKVLLVFKPRNNARQDPKVYSLEQFRSGPHLHALLSNPTAHWHTLLWRQSGDNQLFFEGRFHHDNLS